MAKLWKNWWVLKREWISRSWDFLPNRDSEKVEIRQLLYTFHDLLKCSSLQIRLQITNDEGILVLPKHSEHTLLKILATAKHNQDRVLIGWMRANNELWYGAEEDPGFWEWVKSLIGLKSVCSASNKG